MNTANKSLNSEKLHSFLPTTSYEQKILSNQKVFGVNTMGNQKKKLRKSYHWENSV